MRVVAHSPHWEGKDRDRELFSLWSNLFNRWNTIPSLTRELEDDFYFEKIIAELSRLQDEVHFQSKLISLDTGHLNPHHSLIVGSLYRLLPDFSSDIFSSWEEEEIRSDFYFRNRARQELLRWLTQESFWEKHEAVVASQIFQLLSKLSKTLDSSQWSSAIQIWLSTVNILWDEPFLRWMEQKSNHPHILDIHPLFQKQFFQEKFKLVGQHHSKARL